MIFLLAMMSIGQARFPDNMPMPDSTIKSEIQMRKFAADNGWSILKVASRDLSKRPVSFFALVHEFGSGILRSAALVECLEQDGLEKVLDFRCPGVIRARYRKRTGALRVLLGHPGALNHFEHGLNCAFIV
jgi:hypothetical protein